MATIWRNSVYFPHLNEEKSAEKYTRVYKRPYVNFTLFVDTTYQINITIIFIFLDNKCYGIAPEEREECGYYGIQRDECENDNGCCFDHTVPNVAWCFKGKEPAVPGEATVPPAEAGEATEPPTEAEEGTESPGEEEEGTESPGEEGTESPGEEEEGAAA